MKVQVIYTNTKKRRKAPRGKGWQDKEYYQKVKKSEFVPLTTKPSYSQMRAMENRDKYPSRVESFGDCSKKEPMKYTGTLIKGIATMHKSNAVPVINDDEAKDISRMRR